MTHDPKTLAVWISKAESTPGFAKAGQLERWRAELEALQQTAEIPEIFTVTITESPKHTLETRLSDRRISDRTALTFGIESFGHGWKYPIPNGGDAKRWKAYSSSTQPKYKWIPSKPEKANYYHAENLLDAIQENAGACWMASGEADVWALYSAGIEHVFSAGYGESHIPEDLAEVLQSMGVLTIYIAPDLDLAGAKWARKVANRLKDSGIELDARRLPESLGKGGDLGQAWETYTRDSWPFERWLLGLPRTEIKPEIERKRTPPNITAGDIPEAYRQLIADALDVSNFGTDGFSIKNVLCPFHDEARPSASLHQVKGLYCHHSGEWHRWTDIGTKIDVGSLSEWIVANPDQGRFVVLTLSTETREALIKSGLTAISRLYDALYAAGLTPDAPFTTKEATDLCQPYEISRWAIHQAIAKDTDRRKLLRFFPPFNLQHNQPEKMQTNSKGGPKAKVYKVLSPVEVAQLAGVRRKYQHYEVIPPEMIKKASHYRAAVYAALPERRPGPYSRKRLGTRLGVTTRTTQNYDKLADLEVTPRFEKEELTSEDIERLHDERKDAPAWVWLEDEQGKRYQPTKAGAEYALRWSDKIYRVMQLSNSYKRRENDE